jgi:biopolymer transport protein ExbD
MAHRRHHEDASGGVNLNLVITPMLDMSFQLLAFFIMTYHPSALEASIEGKLLPPVKAVSAGPTLGEKKDETPPADEKPDEKLTARLKIRKDIPRGAEGQAQPFKLLVELQKPQIATYEPVLSVEFRNDRQFRKLLASSKEDLDQDAALKGVADSLKNQLDQLKKELLKIRNEPGGERISLTLDADPSLLWGYCILVQDTCKAARFESVGFAAPLPAGQ